MINLGTQTPRPVPSICGWSLLRALLPFPFKFFHICNTTSRTEALPEKPCARPRNPVREELGNAPLRRLWEHNTTGHDTTQPARATDARRLRGR